MEIFEIIFDNVKGTATRLTSTTADTSFKVVVNDQYFIMQVSYSKKEQFILLECGSGMTRLKQPNKCRKFHGRFENTFEEPARPPKRYRG